MNDWFKHKTKTKLTEDDFMELIHQYIGYRLRYPEIVADYNGNLSEAIGIEAKLTFGKDRKYKDTLPPPSWLSWT